jgi:hypothetical protein
MMDPYAPPKTETRTDADEDADLEAVTPTRLSRIGGGVAIATGLYTLLLAIQTMAAIRFEGAMELIVPAMLALGAVLLVLGWFLRKFRGWAALGVAIVGGVAALLALVWFVMSFLIGLLTLMPLIVSFAATASCVLAALSVGPARRADAARARLDEQGMVF